MRVMPMRMPSRTAITPWGSQWIPVSSSTSFTATSAGEYPDVGPPRGVQPHARVGALHEQDPALVVVHHRADGRLGGDVARHPFADVAHPLVDVVLDVELRVSGQRGADVPGDVEDLLEALLFVQALGEPEPGAGDGREGLGPAHEVLPGGRVAVTGGRGGIGHQRGACSSPYPGRPAASHSSQNSKNGSPKGSWPRSGRSPRRIVQSIGASSAARSMCRSAAS